jgi:alpha-aminoadipate carrier protein LysW
MPFHRFEREVQAMAECPVCGAEFQFGDATEKGEIITCSDCGSELEVTGPDSVQEAPQEEEDWGE